MQLKLDNLLIKKMGQDYVIPLSDISIIVAEGGETVVTLRLLSALSKHNIALIVSNKDVKKIRELFNENYPIDIALALEEVDDDDDEFVDLDEDEDED